MMPIRLEAVFASPDLQVLLYTTITLYSSLMQD